ncbi:4-hydroxythreonine-4-phosphate dehydrogenase [Desulfosarcina alkanivorans]|uniref:4-hydroxythreonine-4-phosphate dehydrogenase n=1 Tax=Desulfosarcina alkanivorans TaxID=571177 RepID=A0A5K7YRY4_9BACT|nr:4-hydroxythreonine-4-phosphate dehydrogenase PdxA [Desulfosarcina alkanivorans]BBO72582.1 4-hydroxythreonine-4-phosphate dehydrogenase [Desulfosarcina alkanivorans]
MKPNLPLVAVTMGDPVGIGPEIIPKALADPRLFHCCRPVIYGDAACLKAGAASTGTSLALTERQSIDGASIGSHGIVVVNPEKRKTSGFEWASPTAASGTAMAAYLNSAIDDAVAGRISAIATGPINKRALKMAGIPFSGHTEILAQRTGTSDYAMMLAGARLKVVLATIHIPLEQVSRTLTTEGITKVVALTDHSLRTRFGLAAPRIAVAGLNPHAGESGLFGNEESAIITPAIALCASRGITVTGPHPPDTVFFNASRGAYDAVVAMYHDQGLGPFKMIHFDDGVNTTLGLPFVRTSVDHGTAYDIAGTGKASADSMVAAITMAATQARWLSRQGTP